MEDVFSNYLESIRRLVLTTNVELISMIKNELLQAGQSRNTIYIIGNGISSATSEHFANDLTKKASEHLVNHSGYRLNTIILTEPISFVTAVANDLSLDDIFVESLKSGSRKDDLLFIFSSSKPHENIIKAVRYAREKGLKTVAIAGLDSGVLEQFSDIYYAVKSDQPDLVETVFIFLCHYLAEVLSEELKQPDIFPKSMIV